MTKCLIYARVSTLGQSAEDRISLDEQVKVCAEYAGRKGYEVVDVMREVKSAGSVRGRPLLLDAMYRIRNREAEVLLAYCLDRLTREQAGMFVIDEEVKRGDGRIEFATEEFGDDAIGRFTRSARAFAAEIELERIAARSAMGRRGRLSKDWLLVSSRARFGYSYAGEHKERYEINPETAPVVQRIFNDYVAGKSINGITIQLDAEGVPTSTGKGRWHKSQVRNVLSNRAYIGEARMMRRKYGADKAGNKGKGKYAARPDEEQVLLPAGTIPPLVDVATFERVQLRLTKNKEVLHDPQAKTDALLRGGFVKCGQCGCTMRVARHKHRNRDVINYRCKMSGAGRCVPNSISARRLDAEVWSRIEAILGQPERLRRLLDRPERDLSAEIAQLDSRIEELKRESAALTRAIAKLDEGDDATDSLLDEVREVSKRRRAVEESRERLIAEAEDAEARTRQVEATVAAVAGVSERVANLDYHEKRQVMIDLGVKVAVYPASHPTVFRWTMTAFERRPQGGKQLWLESEYSVSKECREAALQSYNCTRAAARALQHD